MKSKEEEVPVVKVESKKLKRKKKKETPGEGCCALGECSRQQKQPKVEKHTPSAEESSPADKKEKKKREEASVSISPTLGRKKIRRFSNGYVIENLAYGPEEGPVVSEGKSVSIKYEGRLKDGTVFDKTKGTHYFTFEYGKGEVIKGLDKGLDEMRVGDRRRLTVPSRMGYASKGAPPAIPPDSDLSFDIELMKID